MNRKNIVSLNDPKDGFLIFKNELVPNIVDVRGEKINVDLGDWTHIIVEHEEMCTRIRWIKETLKNPLEIRRHFNKNKYFRELYLNTIYKDTEDEEGEGIIVVVDTRIKRKLWTAFIPNPEYVKLIKKGKLLWQKK